MAEQIILFTITVSYLTLFVQIALMPKDKLVQRKLLHMGAFGLWVLYLIFNLNFYVSMVFNIGINIVLAILSYRTKQYGITIYGACLLFSMVACHIDANMILPTTLSMAILSFSDGLSALCGFRSSQTLSSINDKTTIGSLVFFLVTCIILLPFIDVIIALELGLLLTLVEYLSDNKVYKINDNIMIFSIALLLLCRCMSEC